jgi:hypothetical protein
MTIGASETFGTGTTPGKEFPAQLEDSLAAHGCYRVLNAAMVGMSLRAMIQYWHAWASRFHPDFVLVLALPTMYLGDSPPAFPRPQIAPQRPTGIRLASRLLERSREYIDYPDFIQRQRVQNHLDELTAGRPAEWYFSSVPTDRVKQYALDLDSMVVAIRATGAEPLLAAYPTVFEEAISPDDSARMAAWREWSPRAKPAVMLPFMSASANAVRDVGRVQGVTVVDLPARLNGHPDLFADITHYSNQGAGVVAGMVAQAVLGVMARQKNALRPNAAGTSVREPSHP